MLSPEGMAMRRDDLGVDALAARMGRVKHFAGLPASALQAIVAAGEIRRFAAGSVIFMEGEPCAGMFVLLSGCVHLCKLGPRGQQYIMVIIEPVIMFNEVAVLDGGPNPVMAVAAQDCVTWRIGCAAFHALLQCYPIVGLALLPVLARRNRMLLARWEDISSRSVLARTAKLLLDLSSLGKQPIDRSQHPMEEIASRVSSVREPVSRALKTLRDDGLITITRDTIIIRRVGELARVANIEILESQTSEMEGVEQ